MLLWGIVIMNYQINAYYTNFYSGDSYDTLIFITIVELCSYIVADIAFEKIKHRPAIKLYIAGFAICLVGSIGILTNDITKHPWRDLGFNYLCKFGIAAAFQGCFLATTVLFPIIFASTTFGACNLFGTISAFFSVDMYGL